MTSARFTRWAAAAASLVVATALLSAAGTAEAVTLQPRTYTAAMTPATAPAGQSTDYSVVVKNTSTVISALDHFTLVAPTGFTVVPGSVTAPRTGWRESFSAGLLTAITTQPVKYGLRKGESMTVKFSATDPNACDSSLVKWVQKADGAIIDPFKAQSPDPTVQMTATAARNFDVTSVTDASNPPLHDQVVAGEPFTVTGRFLCGGASAPAGSAGTVALSKTSGVAPNLGGTVSTAVVATDTTATISGATYSQVENGVGITATWSGGAGDSFNLNVLGDAATVVATPHVAIPVADLTVTGASADLGNGANGPVSIVVDACGTDSPGTPCSGGTQVELTGNFKDAAGVALYGFGVSPKPLAPAIINWLCPNVTCPHSDTAGEPSSLFNYPGNDEGDEEFESFPVFVSLHTPSGETPFAAAPRCVEEEDLGTTNQIKTVEAQAAGFCVDVNAITRSGNSFTGDLKMPVLFVEDLRLRP